MIELNKNDHLIKMELMRLVATNSFLSGIALFFNVIVISIAFWNITSQTFLLIWIFLIALALIMRAIVAKSFLNNPTKKPLLKVEKYFKTYTILALILLTAGLIIILPEDLPFHQAFLSMIVAGLSAGAVMSLSFFKSFIQKYLLIFILPFTYVIYIQGTQLHILIAISMLLFLVMLILFSRRYNTSIIEVITSKIVIEQTQKEKKVSENNFSTIFKEAPIGVFTYDKNLIINQANQTFSSLLKAPLEKLIGLNMSKLSDQSIRPALDIVIQGEKGFYEGSYHTKISNKDLWISMQTVPMYDIENNIKGGLGIVKDITERIESEKKIRHQAFYDHLTGLANRLTLNERLERQLSRLSRHNRFGAILFIDLDNFKTINDSLGHHIGDTLLKTFATRAPSIIRKEDTVARLGGDEFVVLLSDLSSNELDAVKKAYKTAKKLHNLMKEPIVIEEHKLHITLSIGIVTIGSKQDNINDILKHADIAMYKAKQSGRNTTCIFEQKMSQKIQEQHKLGNELREAIQLNQLELYYQPIVETKTSKIISCEALIRWNHPTQGLIYPDEFIPYAEDSDFIINIGDWVIRRACMDYKKLSHHVDNIAINISSKQFTQEEFVDYILKITTEYDVKPSSFKLELTESVAVDNLSSTVEKMKLLKHYGFAIAMDDFGTGYSSLSYLKNLPFDFLKIDRSFIQHVLDNKDDASLVKTILTISKQFKFDVIAEGVETKAHVEFLKALDCEYYQGYYISKAVTLEEFKKL